jgi:hypothetical protein
MAAKPPCATCNVPPVAVIGFIPFFRRRQDLPKTVAYKSGHQDKAYDLLFDSGNNDPEPDLGPIVNDPRSDRLRVAFLESLMRIIIEEPCSSTAFASSSERPQWLWTRAE